MERWKKRSIELLSTFVFEGREAREYVPYYPQKTLVNGREERFFHRTVPEKKGISSLRLYNMLSELENENRSNVHSLMVLCGGEVICECSSYGYSVNEWHISHSMSKTVTGMVIGCLIDREKLALNTKIVDIFPEISFRDRRFSSITISHLLSMSSGVDFYESGAVTETDWTKEFFSSAVRFAPGSSFSYNSMNSYLLSRIAERVSQESFCTLADRLIFSPLGIKNYLWEKSPEGTGKGGWGLYMSAESWAKVGTLILYDGCFMGRRVFSKRWARLSSKIKAAAKEENGGFDYAYQMWSARGEREVLFNGMLGQNLLICPKNDIIAVMTCGNNEFFQSSPTLEIFRKYLCGRIDDDLSYRPIKTLLQKEKNFFSSRRTVRPLRAREGLLVGIGLKPREPFDSLWESVLGDYRLAQNRTSLIPLVIRVMQNYGLSSISEISLSRKGEGLIMEINEGEWSYRIPVGLYGYKESVISYREEKYVIRATARAVTAGDETEYKIEIIFPETASTRYIFLKREGKEGWNFCFSESPDTRLVENILQRYRKTSPIISFVMDMLERRIGKEEMKKFIRKAVNPSVFAVSKSSMDCEKIIEENNKSATSESATTKIVKAVIDRFFTE